MSTTNDFTENDVLVLFPASKNFKEPVVFNNPIHDLFEETQGFVDVIEKRKNAGLLETEELLTLAQITHALEVRLNMLEEAKDRLKFYLDDLELEFSKK